MFKMTPIVLKNLVSPAATRRYPAEIRPEFENFKGKPVHDLDTCTFCGICALKCPSQCLEVDKKSGTWTFDPFACVYCGICVESCPSGSLSHAPRHSSPVSGG